MIWRGSHGPWRGFKTPTIAHLFPNWWKFNRQTRVARIALQDMVARRLRLIFSRPSGQTKLWQYFRRNTGLMVGPSLILPEQAIN